jgi:hypothetical protein
MQAGLDCPDDIIAFKGRAAARMAGNASSFPNRRKRRGLVSFSGKSNECEEFV